MGILLVGANRPSRRETISRMMGLIARAWLVRRRFFELKKPGCLALPPNAITTSFD
jgi:hypothetical protein